jgi:hypothetical protein
VGKIWKDCCVALGLLVGFDQTGREEGGRWRAAVGLALTGLGAEVSVWQRSLEVPELSILAFLAIQNAIFFNAATIPCPVLDLLGPFATDRSAWQETKVTPMDNPSPQYVRDVKR